MASIRKSGKKYEAQVRRKGHRAYSRSFDTKKDAEKWARQVETSLEFGVQLEGTQEDPSETSETTTFGDLVKRYLKDVTPTKKGARSEAYRLSAFLKHSMCSKPVETLTTKDFAEYRDQRLNDDRLSPSTIRRELAVLSHILELSKKEWAAPLTYNPISDLSLPTVQDERERRLNPGEYDRLVEAARKMGTPYFSELIVLAVETGMRRGELLPLMWKDVDFDKRIVKLKKTKNGYPRTIPLSKTSIAALEALRAPHTAISIDPVRHPEQHHPSVRLS